MTGCERKTALESLPGPYRLYALAIRAATVEYLEAVDRAKRARQKAVNEAAAACEAALEAADWKPVDGQSSPGVAESVAASELHPPGSAAPSSG